MPSDPNIAIFLIALGALSIAAEFCLPGKVIPGVIGGVLFTVGSASLVRTQQPIPWTLALEVWLPTASVLLWLLSIARRARLNKRCITALTLLLLASRASAHHAFAAEYDERKVVTVSGTVGRFQWTNPHAWLYVDVKDANGRVTNWGFEMGSPNGLISRGWKKLELHKGDRITVEAFGSKTKSNIANAKTVTMPDGRKLFGGFGETPGNPYKKKR